MAHAPAKKASQEDWHPADIKAALHKSGITLAALAKQHGLCNSSVLSATFVRSYPLNEKRIADAIGVAPQVIWPSRWNADGSPKPRGFRAMQFNAMERARNGKAAAAGGNQEQAA
jgi:lambda repressor-like predicted transcriptional regulator